MNIFLYVVRNIFEVFFIFFIGICYFNKCIVFFKGEIDSCILWKVMVNRYFDMGKLLLWFIISIGCWVICNIIKLVKRI